MGFHRRWGRLEPHWPSLIGIAGGRRVRRDMVSIYNIIQVFISTTYVISWKRNNVL
jgi:hypothetical protein